jgi:hypothetical protein
MQILFRNTKLNFTKHWGVDESASIIRHFRAVGHSVPDSVRKVIGLGIPTSSQEKNKGHYPNLNDFQEIYEDSMLIHNGEMMAIILHGFVSSIEASEHVRTLGFFFDTMAPCFAPVLRSLEWHCLGAGSVVTISPWTGRYLSVARMDAHSEIFILLFPHGVRISFLQVPAHQEKKCAGQRDLVARRIGTT